MTAASQSNQMVEPRTALIKYRRNDKTEMSPFETTHKIMDLGHRPWWLKNLSKRGYCGTYPNGQMRLAQTDLCHLAQWHRDFVQTKTRHQNPLCSSPEMTENTDTKGMC